MQVSPLVEVDRRPVGTGEAGEQTLELIDQFRRATRGESDHHADWIVPVWKDR